MIKILYVVLKNNLKLVLIYLLLIIITFLSIYYSITSSFYFLFLGVPFLVLTLLMSIGNYDIGFDSVFSIILEEFTKENRKEKYFSDGEHHEYDSDGRIKKTITIKNGCKNGRCIHYYDNGTIEQEYNFLNDVPEGQSRFFNSSGDLIRESNLANGIYIGETKEYYDSENKSIRMIEYHDQNKFEFFNINGVKVCEIFIKSRKVSVDKFRSKKVFYQFLWNKDSHVKYTPKGIWKNYRSDDGSLEYELNFNKDYLESTNTIKKKNFNLLGENISTENVCFNDIQIENFDRNFSHLRLIYKSQSYRHMHISGGSNPGWKYKTVTVLPVSKISDILKFEVEIKETIKMMPDWFDGNICEEGGTINSYLGKECQLTAQELSMYDFIMGAKTALEIG